MHADAGAAGAIPDHADRAVGPGRDVDGVGASFASVEELLIVAPVGHFDHVEQLPGAELDELRLARGDRK